MTLDSQSLDLLKQLKNTLPSEIVEDQQSVKSHSKRPDPSYLHPIETEKDPQKLFHQLICASSDGNIPKHLRDRLKEMEAKEASSLSMDRKPGINSYINIEIPPKIKDNSYVEFHQLLLEEDDDS